MQYEDSDDTPQFYIDSLTQSARERMAHIDFTLLFKGEAVRADLTDRFNITGAQATKDFSLYRQLFPNNIEYDAKLRVHKRGEHFTPVFEYDVLRTLSTISQGYGDGFIGTITHAIPCESPYHLNKPSLAIVAKITEALYKNQALEISYVSTTSGESTREIVPHTLVDNGLRWHVRAYDRKNNQFRDFVLTRFKSAQLVQDSTPSESELKSEDRQWNRFIELELQPHPQYEGRSKFIEMDYGMVNGFLKIEIRAATAGYLLRLWNVDCSEKLNLNEPQFHLALKNRATLYGVEGLSLAPGYEADEP